MHLSSAAATRFILKFSGKTSHIELLAFRYLNSFEIGIISKKYSTLEMFDLLIQSYQG